MLGLELSDTQHFSMIFNLGGEMGGGRVQYIEIECFNLFTITIQKNTDMKLL